MTKIADFKGENPQVLIDLSALARGDVRYVTAGFFEPAYSKPEDATVFTPLEAVGVIAQRRPYLDLGAVPYPVAVFVQGLLEAAE